MVRYGFGCLARTVDLAVHPSRTGPVARTGGLCIVLSPVPRALSALPRRQGDSGSWEGGYFAQSDKKGGHGFLILKATVFRRERGGIFGKQLCIRLCLVFS